MSTQKLQHNDLISSTHKKSTEAGVDIDAKDTGVVIGCYHESIFDAGVKAAKGNEGAEVGTKILLPLGKAGNIQISRVGSRPGRTATIGEREVIIPDVGETNRVSFKPSASFKDATKFESKPKKAKSKKIK